MTSRASSSDAVMLALRRQAAALVGHGFRGSRTSALARAVQGAQRALDLDAPERLLQALEARDPHAIDAFVSELSVGETYFFRDNRYFEHLREAVLPARARDHGRPIRFWSAGCATGEEPYSLAICALESLGPNASFSVLGTDVNRRFLDRAERGCYGAWSFRELDETRRDRWFQPSGRMWSLREEVKAHVEFRPLNLVTEVDTRAWPAGIDVLFCRNVFIYFEAAMVKRTARALARALAPSGVLVLGPSDPLLGQETGLVAERRPGLLVYRRAEDAAAEQANLPTPPHAPPPPRASTTPPASTPSPPSRPKQSRRAEFATPANAPPHEGVRASRAPSTDAAKVVLDVSSAESPPATEPRLREAMRSAERLADAGSYDEALDELRAVHAIAPFQLEAHILEANVLQAKGDHAAALDALDRALMLDRRLAIAYLHAAASHEARGDEAARQKALRNARTWLARFDPDEQVPAAGGATAGELLAVCERLAARGAGGRGRRP